jgi:hypothetical protein
MRYVTQCALAIKGDRIEKGTEVELSVEDAARFDILDLAPVGPEVAPEPEEPEPAIEDMTLGQLKKKATDLSLSANGSKADLVERITLHLQGE